MMSAEALRAAADNMPLTREGQPWRGAASWLRRRADAVDLAAALARSAPGSEWVGPLLAYAPPGRDDFWSYQECPRGVVGMNAHRRLGLVHRIRAADRRHACEDVIHPSISTSHRRSVAVEDTAVDLAPNEVGGGS